jgi:hypothetical protein
VYQGTHTRWAALRLQMMVFVQNKMTESMLMTDQVRHDN